MQTEVRKFQAVGIVGQIAKECHSFKSTVPKVATTNVRIGSFVQTGTLAGEVEAIDGALTGGVVGVITLEELISSTVELYEYKKGMNVTVLVEGTTWIETDVIVTDEQFIHIDDATGAVVFDNSKTKANHTFTGFKTLTGNATAVDGIVKITTAGVR